MRSLWQDRGGRIFLLVWFGQLISLVGSQLTSFGLGVWVYQQTGSVTDFALILVAAVLPTIVLSPFAGAVADRYDRRRVMIVADSAAALSTLSVALLYSTGSLQIWHIYLAALVNSSATAFQMPAYSASISLLVPSEQYGRAAGLGSLSESLSLIFGPLLAGALIGVIGLSGIIALDVLTFVFAVTVVLLVRFPAVPRAEGASGEAPPSFWSEVLAGWKYLTSNRPLLLLILFFAASNLAGALVSVLLTPLVLSYASPIELGIVNGAFGLGMLIGSVLMVTWGGPTRRVRAMLLLSLVNGVVFMLIGGLPSVPVAALAITLSMIGVPILNGAFSVLIRMKVPPELQGRVFSAIMMLAMSAVPVASLLAGPLADRVFEPLMAAGGGLAGSLGGLIGVGDGRGIGLMLILNGLFLIAAAGIAALTPTLRRVETLLPDYEMPDAPPEAAEPAREPGAAA